MTPPIIHLCKIFLNMEEKYILKMAIADDCSRINNLLNKYYVGNRLSVGLDRGYISTQFTHEQILEMINFPGVIVACDHTDEIIATACLSTIKANPSHRSEFASALYNLIKTSSYEGRQLCSYQIAMYGPICVDEKFSGRGIALKLFNLARKTLGQRGFDFGLLFIDQKNVRSMYVHLNKLSVKPVDTFKISNISYVLGIFSTLP